MKNVLAAMIGILLASSLFSQVVPKEKIDAIFAEWESQAQPGGALGIFKDGEMLYAKGYGAANLDYDLPNTPTSVFRIASTSKQFTAACIFLLAEQGKLSLQDPLTKFFPDYPATYKGVQVHHLIHHTSGIRDYLELSYLAGMADEDYYTDEEVGHWLKHQKDLNFEPGEEHLYSNSGYWLLGQIVGVVSEKNMADFAKENIFEPLGMSNTHFHNNAQSIVKNRAYGYQPVDDGFEISMTPLDMIGDGGIFTTIEDFKKWDDAYYNDAVLSKEFWKGLTTTGKLNNGEDTHYAGGLFMDEYNGKKRIGHGGAFVGFRADFNRIPAERLTVVLFTNRADGRPSGKVRAVLDLLYPKVMPTDEAKEPTAEPKIVTLTESQLYPGDYVAEDNPEMTLKVSVEENQVQVLQTWNDQGYPIALTDQGYFVIEGVPDLAFTFTGSDGNAFQGMEVIQRGNTSVLKRTVPFDASQLKPEAYVGNYYSAELNCQYQLVMENEQLVFHINGKNKAITLRPSNTDIFKGEGRTLDFGNQPIKGQYSQFVLKGGRAKGLVFVKQ